MIGARREGGQGREPVVAIERIASSAPPGLGPLDAGYEPEERSAEGEGAMADHRDVLGTGYAAFNRGDIQGILENFDEDIEFVWPNSNGCQGRVAIKARRP